VFPLVIISSMFTYPIVVKWTWGLGWLFDLDFVDFAGSCVVHLAGATSSLVACVILGPRVGSFPHTKGACFIKEDLKALEK
jgi:Amt family ammonium transporter